MTEEMSMNESKVYEVGFLISPVLAEEKIVSEVAEIRDFIEKNKGTIIFEEFPKLRPLAYAISTSAPAKRNFDKSYFGFLKFTAEPEAALSIKDALSKKESIIRFILIKTIKDNTMYGPKLARGEGSSKPIRKTSKEQGASKTSKESIPSPINEAELDKTIEELVVE